MPIFPVFDQFNNREDKFCRLLVVNPLLIAASLKAELRTVFNTSSLTPLSREPTRAVPREAGTKPEASQ